MAKFLISRWLPGGHKIGQIAKIKKTSGLIIPKCITTPSFITKRAVVTDDD
jgi:hypothetical protein